MEEVDSAFPSCAARRRGRGRGNPGLRLAAAGVLGPLAWRGRRVRCPLGLYEGVHLPLRPEVLEPRPRPLEVSRVGVGAGERDLVAVDRDDPVAELGRRRGALARALGAAPRAGLAGAPRGGELGQESRPLPAPLVVGVLLARLELGRPLPARAGRRPLLEGAPGVPYLAEVLDVAAHSEDVAEGHLRDVRHRDDDRVAVEEDDRAVVGRPAVKLLRREDLALHRGGADRLAGEYRREPAARHGRRHALAGVGAELRRQPPLGDVDVVRLQEDDVAAVGQDGVAVLLVQGVEDGLALEDQEEAHAVASAYVDDLRQPVPFGDRAQLLAHEVDAQRQLSRHSAAPLLRERHQALVGLVEEHRGERVECLLLRRDDQEEGGRLGCQPLEVHLVAAHEVLYGGVAERLHEGRQRRREALGLLVLGVPRP